MPLDAQGWPPEPQLHLPRPGEPELATGPGGMPPAPRQLPIATEPHGYAQSNPLAVPVGPDVYPTQRRAPAWTIEFDAAGNAVASFVGYVALPCTATTIPVVITAAPGSNGMIAYQQAAPGNAKFALGVDADGNFTLLDNARGGFIDAWWSKTDGGLKLGAGLYVVGSATVNGNLVNNASLWTTNATLAGVLTGTNGANFGSNTVNSSESLNGPVGSGRQIALRTLGVNRWQQSLGGGETGSGNAGSDWRLDRYDDSGAFLGNPVYVTRSSGRVTLAAVAPGHLIGGCSDGGAAGAGNVGEFMSVAVGSASPVSYPTTNVFMSVATITLTAGDWDVSGAVGVNNSGATITQVQGFTTTTAPPTGPGVLSGGAVIWVGSVGSGTLLPCSRYRASVAATTTLYLVAWVAFTGGTVSVWGYMSARRRR